MLLILSLLAADPAAMMKVAAARAATVCVETTCDAAPARSPYRLDPNVAGPADGKADALAFDGSECAVTGPKLCTHKERTIYSATY